MLNKDSRDRFSALIIGAIIIAPLLITTGLQINNGNMVALFISIVLLWFTELIPLAATGLLVPCLAILYGIATPKTAFGAFGNQILFLFIGAFLIGRAMQKHGWDKRVAYFILSSKVGCQSPSTLATVIALTCWSLSMWISNTATCVIMTPIVLGILVTLKEQFNDDSAFQRYSIRLLLICAFASSIGGLATPVGTPPNLLAIEFLAEQGIHINFLNWMGIGLPISLTMLVILLAFLTLRYPVPQVDLQNIRQQFIKHSRELGKIKKAELQVAFCFLLAMTLWTAPGLIQLAAPDNPVLSVIQQRLPMGGVALLCALILFCLPLETEEKINGKQSRNLTWQDAQKIDWGTVLLFGGGLCLGKLLNETGLAKEIGELFFGSDRSILIAALGAILIAILFSEFSSNTASASILIPIIIGTFNTEGTEVLTQLVLATAFGASYGFMLPVSTPPNAVVYGTGKIPLQQMIRTGVIFDLSGYLIIAFFVIWALPAVGIL